MFKEFKEFAMKGSVLDMAIGIIIGAAFSPIVKALVDNIIMPPIGMLLGNVDFTNLFYVLQPGDPAGPYMTLAEAGESGAVVIGYGVFINAVITFLIVALAVFMMVRSINRMRQEEEEEAPAAPTTKDCPRCFSTIHIEATRCPNCTTEL